MDSFVLRADLRGVLAGIDKPHTELELRKKGYKGRDLKALEKNRAKLHKRVLAGKKGASRDKSHRPQTTPTSRLPTHK